MACERCQLPYPAELLTQMFIGNVDGKSGYTAPVCGICALEISNEIHGKNGCRPRKRFDGEMAEEMRQGAIRWRKKHGK